METLRECWKRKMRTDIIFLVMAIMFCQATADIAKDRAECTEQLAGLAACLPYVGGDAKAPTPDCCSGLKQVLKTSKKCLCVIVRDRNDPELGLNINATLALGLPSVCHAPANVSECPALLHMDPNSPEALVFYQFANNSSSRTVGAPAASPSGSGLAEGSPTSATSGGNMSWNATGTGDSNSSNAGEGRARVDVVLIIVGFASVWFLRYA